MMDIVFKDRKLEKTFNEKSKLTRTYGAERAVQIGKRMAELRAAKSLADLGPPYSRPARCHELAGDRKGRLSVDLKHPYRLLFIPHPSLKPKKPDGGLDWTEVATIKILGVEDTHG